MTEDALDMWGVVPIEDKKIKQAVKQISELPDNSDLFRGMTCCHSLTVINGEMTGDPLDVKVMPLNLKYTKLHSKHPCDRCFNQLAGFSKTIIS